MESENQIELIESKRCTRCRQVKAISEFPPNKRHSDRLSSHCNKCNAYYHEIQRERRSKKNICVICGKNKIQGGYKTCDKCLERGRAWARENRKSNQERYLLYGIKRRAKESGIEFSITSDDISIPNFCPVLGIPIISSCEDDDYRPSVDRIDASKGYIPGNVAVISMRANRGKSYITAEEHRLIADWMDKVMK